MWVLTVQGGESGPSQSSPFSPETPSFFLMAGHFKLGRKECDIMFPAAKSVSRHHATVKVEPLPDYSLSDTTSRPLLTIQDEKSKYSTQVNGKVLAPETPAELKEGDVVLLGRDSWHLTVTWEPQVVCVSRLPTEEKEKARGLLSKAGTHLVEEWTNLCTHLLVDDKPVRGTLKVVHAVVKGCPVVTMAWVKALAERGKPSDPLPDVQAYPPDWSKCVVPKLGIPRSRSLAKYKMIFIHVDEVEGLVEAAGAEVVQAYLEDDGPFYKQILPQGDSEKRAVVVEPEKGILTRNPECKRRLDHLVLSGVPRTDKTRIAASLLCLSRLRSTSNVVISPDEGAQTQDQTSQDPLSQAQFDPTIALRSQQLLESNALMGTMTEETRDMPPPPTPPPRAKPSSSPDKQVKTATREEDRPTPTSVAPPITAASSPSPPRRPPPRTASPPPLDVEGEGEEEEKVVEVEEMPRGVEEGKGRGKDKGPPQVVKGGWIRPKANKRPRATQIMRIDEEDEDEDEEIRHRDKPAVAKRTKVVSRGGAGRRRGGEEDELLAPEDEEASQVVSGVTVVVEKDLTARVPPVSKPACVRSTTTTGARRLDFRRFRKNRVVRANETVVKASLIALAPKESEMQQQLLREERRQIEAEQMADGLDDDYEPKRAKKGSRR